MPRVFLIAVGFAAACATSNQTATRRARDLSNTHGVHPPKRLAVPERAPEPPPAPPTRPESTPRAAAATPIATVESVAVYAGSPPGHAGTSDPSIFLGNGIDPTQSYTVTGLYRPALGTLWSGYPPHPCIRGAGVGSAILGRDEGMDVLPLREAIRADADAIVRVVLDPVTRRDEFGRDLVLFSPRRIESEQPTRKAHKIAGAFHRRHQDALRALEEQRSRRSLPRIDVALDTHYDVQSEKLVFEASASVPLGVAWTVAYVLGPPYHALSEIYLSSLFLGE